MLENIPHFIVGIYCCIFMAVLIIDWRRHIIPNKIIYPSLVLALVLLLIDVFSPVQLFNNFYSYPEAIILSGLLGGICSLVLSAFVFYVGLGRVGAGDVKLAGLIGLVVGFPMVFLALFIGVVSASMVAFYFILHRGGNYDGKLPFGSFLAVGAIGTLLWGQNIIAWGVGYWGC